MYHIFLDGVAFPLAPAKIELKFGNQNKTITLINDGEVNVIKTPGLTDVSFSLVIPAMQQYPMAYYPEGFHGAPYYLDKLESLKTGKSPFQLLIVRTHQDALLFDTSLTVTLEEFPQVEDVKDGQDVTVSLKLKQYRHYGTRTVKVNAHKKTATTAKQRPTTGKKEVKTATVKNGDTLWAIAKKTLGDATRWPEIYNTNKQTIEAEAKKRGMAGSDNGHWIFTGTTLTIPGV